MSTRVGTTNIAVSRLESRDGEIDFAGGAIEGRCDL